MKRSFGFFAVTLLLSSACYQIRKTSNMNLAFVYDKEVSKIHPYYSIFHDTASFSTLYFNVEPGELLFKKQLPDNKEEARVSLSYKAYDFYESKDIIDSNSVIIRLENLRGETDTGKKQIRIPSKPGSNYILEITLEDLNSNRKSISYLHFDKTNTGNKYNYQVIKEDGKTLFQPFISSHNKLKITHSGRTVDRLIVRYYNREFPLAAPPFSIHNPKPFGYEADSIFELPAVSGTCPNVSFQREGFYFIQADSSIKEGLSLFQFGKSFPLSANVTDLIEPLRYLSTKSEFDKLIEHSNPKLAVDSFWLSAAGGTVRGRDLIKKFYNRVQNANEYFSSYIEGWKTDRGLVYIIYGKPNIVYRTSDAESWVYGEENNLLSLNFTFMKIENPFSDNDYNLNRSPIYRNNWYRAVDSWRQGRVFADN